MNMAGLSWFSPYANNSNYLYSSSGWWWNLSPYFSDNVAWEFLAYNGRIYKDGVTGVNYIVPVINLRADTQVIGEGTELNPYVVK